MAEFRCSKYISGSCPTSCPGSFLHELGVSCLLFLGVSGFYFHSSKTERGLLAANSPKSSGIYAIWVNLIPSFILELVAVVKLVVFMLISLCQCHVIIPRIWGGVRCTQTMSTRSGMGVVSKETQDSIIKKERRRRRCVGERNNIYWIHSLFFVFSIHFDRKHFLWKCCRNQRPGDEPLERNLTWTQDSWVCEDRVVQEE